MKLNYLPEVDKILPNHVGDKLYESVKESGGDDYTCLIRTKDLSKEYLIQGCYVKTREGDGNQSAYLNGYLEIHGHSLEKILGCKRIIEMMTGIKLKEHSK